MSQDTQQQEQFKILLIGDSCSDLYIFGDCERISPEAPVPVFTEVRRELRPGMALNVEKNLKNLGLEVVSIVNDNPATKTRYVDNRYTQHLLRVDENLEVVPLSQEKAKNIDTSEIAAVIFSDYDKGFLTHEMCLFLCEKFRNDDIPVFVDSKKRDLSCFENSILKINKLERSLVTKYPKDYSLITTLGSQGSIFNGKVFPAYNIEKRLLSDQRDASGAGDTFISSLVYSFLRHGRSLSNSIVFANKCASITVNKFGTYAISQKDLLFLENDKLEIEHF
mgnify:CR=1 FL=1